MKQKSTKPLLVCSIFMLVCAGWNFVWKLVKLFFDVYNTTRNVVDSGFDYTNTDSWTGLVNVTTILGVVNSLLVAITIFLQTAAAVVGLVYAIAYMTNHNIKFVSFPLGIGITAAVFGFLSMFSLILQIFMNITFSSVITMFTLFVMPLIFAIYANKFRKENTTTAESHLNE